MSRLAAVAALVATAVGAAAAAAYFRSPPSPLALRCPPVLDLGDQPLGAVAVGRLTVENSGGSALRLHGFATSCSCAGVEVERHGVFSRVSQVEIAPASAVTLSVRVAAGARVGSSQNISVAFSSNDPARPLTAVTVVIPRILGGVHAQPSVALFGEIPAGTRTSKTIRLYDNSIAGRRVAAVRVVPPARLTARLVQPDGGGEVTPPPGAGRHIASVEITPLADTPGSLRGAIEVVLAEGGDTPDRIEVLGEVVGPVVCRPSALVLPRTASGRASYRGDVRVAWRGGRAAGVTVTAAPTGVSTVVRPDPDDPHVFVVAVHGRSETPAAGPLRILVQGPGGASATAEVFVVVGGSP